MNGIKPFAGVLLAFGAASVSAQGDNSDGFYVGMGLGNYSTEYSDVNDIGDLDDVDLNFDEDEDAFKLFGGWRFNRILAFQVDRYEFEESTSAQNQLNVTAETRGWAPSVVGTWPVGPIELLARAGFIFYDVEFSSDNSNFLDSSGRDPVYSVGLGFTVLQRLSLKLEYEEIGIDEFDEAEAAWLSASWRF
jgi:hypothetical protein